VFNLILINGHNGAWCMLYELEGYEILNQSAYASEMLLNELLETDFAPLLFKIFYKKEGVRL